MKKSAVLVTSFAMALAGCASQPKTTFVRVDGQPFDANPTYQGQYDSDLISCRENKPKSTSFGLGPSAEGDPCMEEKGYVQVTAESAEAKRAELAAIADRKRIAVLPPPPNKRNKPFARRRVVQTPAKPTQQSVRQEAGPVSTKPKASTNPLRLQD